jgi:hypothetical protein
VSSEFLPLEVVSERDVRLREKKVGTEKTKKKKNYEQH